jgi:sugar lactone lactonase YvrE
VTTPQESQHITVVPVPGPGAEDVVVATHGPDEGSVFTGTEDGAIWRISHDGAKVDRVAETAGRPLGLEIDLDGRLLVCDAHRGLLRVDTRSGGVEVVADSVDGVRMVFCNNAAIASGGNVWFSDSSTKYGVENWKSDFVQNTRTGRLLRLDIDGTITTVLDGLAFANGVALAKDESYVAVAETAARTVVRHFLTGPKAGTRDYLAQDLPGYPDNIARGSDGLIWITIASPTDKLVERLQGGPMFVRKSVTRIPDRLQPKPKRTVRVQALDDSGTVVHDVDVKTDGYHMVTGVREHDGRLWLGSLHEPAVAVLDRP